MAPARVDHAAQGLVARDFGRGFAGEVEAAPLGQWTGPIASSFGAHLVRVSVRTPAVLPELDAIRPIVAREWENERRVNARSASLDTLRANYTVVIEAKKTPSLAAR